MTDDEVERAMLGVWQDVPGAVNFGIAKPMTEQELEPIRRRMMMEAYNAADDCDFERYNALKVMANDVLDMLLGVKNDFNL